MSQVDLKVEQRIKSTKSHNHQLRRDGYVPGIVYHKGEQSISVKIKGADLTSAMHTDAGRNVLLRLSIADDKAKEPRIALFKEVQVHPLTGNLVHVDLHQISLKDKIRVRVRVICKGEAPGVKNQGGILEIPMHQIEVECLPLDIPEHIDIDVSALALNQAVHVNELNLPKNVIATEDPHSVVVHVVAPKIEEPAAETGEVKEPEVITKKKEEDAEGGEAKDAAAKEQPKQPAKDKDKGK